MQGISLLLISFYTAGKRRVLIVVHNYLFGARFWAHMGLGSNIR